MRSLYHALLGSYNHLNPTIAMFKKLFGGDKKEQAPPTPPPPPPVSKDVEAERVIMSLEQQIRTLTDESNKLDNKVDVLTEKAK